MATCLIPSKNHQKANSVLVSFYNSILKFYKGRKRQISHATLHFTIQKFWLYKQIPISGGCDILKNKNIFGNNSHAIFKF